MQVADAQREVRLTFMGGFPGQLVSGLIWLVSAALGTWSSTRNAIVVLVVGGAFIFPLTQLLLRAMGRRASLDPANPLTGLAMQIAFTIPISLPLIGAATLHRTDWFYPAFLVVVGAHYLPFVFLYGMWTFALLAAIMIVGGIWIGLTMAGAFSIGGWFGGAVILAFAILGLILAGNEERRGASATR
ncbi:MAG: DUF7010 family protein [Candidatus Eiseniibacteriota bacterium]